MIEEENNSVAEGVHEDTWIPSTCSMCYNQCGILVHKINGVVVKIEGNPDSPLGLGKLCPKGLSGIMVLYDPHRLNVPLKRTNPEKGIGVDPKWVEISWEEALDEITEKVKKIIDDDPRKLAFIGCIPSLGPTIFGMSVFMLALGSPNSFLSNGHHCGNAEHLLAYTLHGSQTTNPDLDYCNYLILFGCQSGTAAYYAFNVMAQRMSDARARGMKLVVVDPMLNAGAEKADEWIPILPGTDGALALAMLNVLLNELGIYDSEYLKGHTNGPYLIQPNGYYLRDQGTKKPLVWDSEDGEAKPYDDSTIKDFALEGVYNVCGVECKPAFQRLKDQVKKWAPEEASKITTIPAETIRRIAKEFGEAARIGSKIRIEGKELPFRPVSIAYFKGAHGHNHAWLTSLAIELLCEVVGASNVPGAFLGCNPVCFGHPETGQPRWAPRRGIDGLLEAGLWIGANEPSIVPGPYPPLEPNPPQSLNLQDLLTTALSGPLSIFSIINPR